MPANVELFLPDPEQHLLPLDEIVNDPAVAQYLFHRALSTEDLFAFLTQTDGDLTRVIGIPSAPVGLVWANRMRPGVCAVSYLLGHPWWGKGIACTAVQAFCSQLFVEQGMHRIEAYVHPGNVRSLSLLSRLGFRFDARLRARRQTPDGEWADELLYAVLATDWPRYRA